MPKNYKLSDLKYSLDKSYNLKINLTDDILTISALEILELGKIILTEFQTRAKMPVVALNSAKLALSCKSPSNVPKKRGRPKGSKMTKTIIAGIPKKRGRPLGSKNKSK